MIAITKQELAKLNSTRTKQLSIKDLTSIGYTITPSMFRGKELVIISSDIEQQTVYGQLNSKQRKEVIEYYQKNYNNISQYKCLGNSRGRFLTLLEQPLNLSETPEKVVRLTHA